MKRAMVGFRAWSLSNKMRLEPIGDGRYVHRECWQQTFAVAQHYEGFCNQGNKMSPVFNGYDCACGIYCWASYAVCNHVMTSGMKGAIVIRDYVCTSNADVPIITRYARILWLYASPRIFAIYDNRIDVAERLRKRYHVPVTTDGGIAEQWAKQSANKYNQTTL